MLITALYDASMAYAPAGYKVAISSAIQFIDQLIADSLTLTVHFGWGETDGKPLASDAVGQNLTYGAFYSYGALRNGLINHATSAADSSSLKSLPLQDPTSGGSFFIPSAQAQVLGLQPGSSNESWVGLNSSFGYSFDPSNRAVAGAYDAIGVLEHEITEALGRVGFLGDYFSSNATDIFGPMDLFRYAAPGVRDLTGDGYFAPDGATLLQKFNDPRFGGDAADWSPNVKGDSFGDAFAGMASQVTAVDITAMDVLGYRIGTSTASRVGTAGNDTIYSTSSNELIDGLAGVDTVVYAGGRAEYQVSFSSAAIYVSDNIPARDGDDQLVNVEQVKFSDITLAFDLHSSQDQLVYEIYQAAFGRIPDVSGFRFWAAAADQNGLTALQLANTFIQSPEFGQRYGNPDIQTFITELYQNVLGRAPDQQGLDYWVGRAQTEVKGQLLVDFATSSENLTKIAPHIQDGYWLT